MKSTVFWKGLLFVLFVFLNTSHALCPAEIKLTKDNENVKVEVSATVAETEYLAIGFAAEAFMKNAPVFVCLARPAVSSKITTWYIAQLHSSPVETTFTSPPTNGESKYKDGKLTCSFTTLAMITPSNGNIVSIEEKGESSILLAVGPGGDGTLTQHTSKCVIPIKFGVTTGGKGNNIINGSMTLTNTTLLTFFSLLVTLAVSILK